MALKDLALTPEEAKDTMLGGIAPDAGDAPKYPYGLCLDLNDEALKKLGITALPAIGSEMRITAVGKVTRISAYEEQDGAEQCLGIQLTAMDMTGPDQTTAQKLYNDPT